MVIYKITNLVNLKIYIGKTVKDKPSYFGSGKRIRAAIKKYGKENFKKEILEICVDKKHLAESEIFWIEKLDARNPNIGYNLSKGGDGGQGWTSESIRKTNEKLGADGRRNRTLKGIQNIGKEGLIKRSIKGNTTLGSKGRSDKMKKVAQTLGEEGLQARATRIVESMGEEGVKNRNKKISDERKNAGKEELSRRAKESVQTMGEKGRLDRNRKISETKRKNREAKQRQNAK